MQISTAPFIAISSENPIPLELETSFANPQNAVPEVRELQLPATIVAGDRLTIRVEGQDYAIDFVAVGATLLPMQCECVAQAQSLAQWTSSVFFPFLEGQLVLGDFALTSLGGGLIRFSYEGAFDFVNLASGFSSTLVNNYAAASRVVNHQVMCVVKVWENGTYIENQNLRAVAQVESLAPYMAKFDLFSRLADLVSSELPALSGSLCFLSEKNTKKIRLHLYEGYGEPVIYGQALEHDFRVVRGRVSERAFSSGGINSLLNLCNVSFLRVINNIHTYKHQKQWVYCFLFQLSNVSSIDVQLEIEIKRADSSTQAILLPTIYVLDLLEVYGFRVGYDDLGLSAYNPNGDIYQYKVRPRNANGSLLAMEQTYTVDYRHNESTALQLVFENPLGGWDTLMCSFGATFSQKTSVETGLRATAWNEPNTISTKKISISDTVQKYELSTPVLSPDYRAQLGHFFSSKRHYLIENDAFYPVTLETREQDVWKQYDNEGDYRLKFTISLDRNV